jgi:arylsulfatase A-like enzyme
VHRPTVVLIVLESFRADMVGARLDGKAVTPVLDALAQRGLSSARAYSHNGYTVQSRFHLFSGSLANLRGGTTLIDDFKANGYEVGYFSGQDDSFGGAGYGVGMERADVAYDARQDRKLRYSTFSTAGSLAVPAEVVQKRIGEFLARRDRSRPLFLYVNFHDTHYPYHHEGMRALVSDRVIAEGQIHPSRAAALQEMYFNAAANVDAAIGSTLQMVEQHLGRAPAVVVTSDHGESLYDEGFLGHGYALNDVQTRVPLVVRGLPVRLEQPVGQVELRDAIGVAMTRDPGEPPSVTLRPDKTVFQYLGNLDRSRQIGLAGMRGRTLFDLRTGRVQVPGTAWLRPADVAPETRAGLSSLAHLWERMLVARDRDGR